VHLVGFTIGIYYDARTYERQIISDLTQEGVIINLTNQYLEQNS
jgi:hypothetical protein